MLICGFVALHASKRGGKGKRGKRRGSAIALPKPSKGRKGASVSYYLPFSLAHSVDFTR